MSRLLRGSLLVAFVAALAGTSRAGDEPKCKLAKGESPMAKACVEGGIAKAKATMKQIVKDGRAAGMKTECDDCHKGDSGYDQITADAREKLTKLLATIEGKSKKP